MLQTYSYRAVFEPGENPAVIVASFPDIPEAVTEGDDLAHARAMATEALGLALLAYAGQGRERPRPSRGPGEWMAVEARIAAKLAVIEAFNASGLTRRDLAQRIDKDEREVRRILDPWHGTKLATLTATLAALGRRLVIGVEALDSAA